MNIRKIAVFCGSNIGNNKQYRIAAKELADTMQDTGIALVYGGAKVGLMGIIADHMLKQGGHVIGVIPQSLVDVEIAHDALSEIHVVNSMHERKALMAELADGFIMLPGGFGSLDEFFEIVTWTQLGYHSKPCGILNINGYFDLLLQFLDHATTEGFIKPVHRHMITVNRSAPSIIQTFLHYTAPSEKKWIHQTSPSCEF